MVWGRGGGFWSPPIEINKQVVSDSRLLYTSCTLSARPRLFPCLKPPHHHPPPQKLNVSNIAVVTDYLNCYWPDFYETLKVTSWEQLEQIPQSSSNLSMQHLSSRHLSISGISQLLLTRFWWNFTGRFLGTSRKASNCHGDICPGNTCPGNICSGDICTYQEYLSCYWHNLD